MALRLVMWADRDGRLQADQGEVSREGTPRTDGSRPREEQVI